MTDKSASSSTTKLADGPRLSLALVLKDAPAALDFYARAFGATEKYRLVEPSGRVGHAEMDLGGVTLMLADEYPEYGIVGPQSRGGTTCSLNLRVEDVDAAAQRAIDAGATLERPIQNEFYGERAAHLRDPFGHRWALNARVEDVSPEEMQRRFTELLKG
ncbi:VOC family protein [Corallococcus macrosporus]|uniref:Glycosylase n=2 Tax=Myxococcaceae TaxID=31 RepID=A0A250K0R2_9BACT|nr:VOC family protein [Corallococcus macrosporus]AEI68908.1 glyoxalase family protein [Corallococcus macrosporus]ATB49675.1 glycosylase [Corallococcus macrosporus DSM 14697]